MKHYTNFYYKDEFEKNEDSLPEVKSEFDYYENDTDFERCIELLQRARLTLEVYFGEKPSKTEILSFVNTISLKDLNNHFEDEDGYSVFAKTWREYFNDEDGKTRHEFHKKGITDIIHER